MSEEKENVQIRVAVLLYLITIQHVHLALYTLPILPSGLAACTFVLFPTTSLEMAVNEYRRSNFPFRKQAMPFLRDCY